LELIVADPSFEPDPRPHRWVELTCRECGAHWFVSKPAEFAMLSTTCLRCRAPVHWRADSARFD
jgi:ribosomal protein L40E